MRVQELVSRIRLQGHTVGRRIWGHQYWRYYKSKSGGSIYHTRFLEQIVNLYLKFKQILRKFMKLLKILQLF